MEIDMNHPAFNCPDHPTAFQRLPVVVQDALKLWIGLSVKWAKTRYDESSYGIKHDAEKDLGFYVGNAELKGAMLAMG